MASSAASLLVLCMCLGKKCFTVSVGGGKVGDTADSNREESRKSLKGIRAVSFKYAGLEVVAWT